MKKLLILFFILSYTLNSQFLSLFDIAPSGFPTIKGMFYAFDKDGKQITNLNTSDFSVKENGQPRIVTSVSCPNPKPPVALSIAMSLDISGSMSSSQAVDIPVELGKRTIIDLLNLINIPNTEFALQTCDAKAYFLQDFTLSKKKIIDKILPIKAEGGNDFVEHLLNPNTGILNIAKTGKNKRIAILYTDSWWYPLKNIELQQCIDICNNYDITFYAVLYTRPEAEQYGIKTSLKQLAEATGGRLFDGITTINAVNELILLLSNSLNQSEPCEIEWISDFNCSINRTNVELKYMNSTAKSDYLPVESSLAGVYIDPLTHKYGQVSPGTKVEQTFSIVARNFDCIVTGINLKFGSNVFSVKNVNFPFTIPKNTRKDITIEYAPIDSSINLAVFEIETNTCNKTFSVNGGFPGYKIAVQTLKLTSPNGGELFVSGNDTLITWEGVSESDTVMLEYSTDNGKSWQFITNKATALKYNWRIPNTPSNQCLVRVKLGGDFKAPTIEWEKSFGGSDEDIALDVKETIDGGYIISGNTKSNDGDITKNFEYRDFWIVKTDKSGNLIWENSYGGSQDESANSILQTNDKGYLIAGWTGSPDSDALTYKGSLDQFIVKISENGNLEWKKCFGGTKGDFAEEIQSDKNGNYIVVGDTQSKDGEVTGYTGNTDIWITKIDKNGNLLWQKCYGSKGSENGSSISMTYDDCIIVAGNTYSKDFDSVGFKGSNDFLVSKFDQSGNLLWHKCYGGSWTEVSSSICSTYDGGFIVVGSTTSKDGDVTENHGNRDFWIMKADIFGNLEWQKSLGGSNDDNANSVQQTSDGGYVVAGYTKSIDGDVIGANTTWDYWVVKLNNIGSIEWQKSLGGNSIEEGNSIQVTRDGGYIVAGTAYSIDGDVTGNHGIADYWVVKLSPENYDQSDVSDAVFSIVAPLATSQDIDMKQCLVGAVKDSIIQNLVQNIGSYKVRVDSIYFTGADADAFGLTSGLPVYELLPGENKATEVLFKPTKVGMHNATLNIVTQSETLKQSIIGEGIQQVLSFSTNLLDFGKVQLGDNKVFLDTALIKNNSNSLIEITDVVMLGPDNLQFNVVSGGGKFTLQPNEERKLDVMFRPIYSGRTSGQLGFVFNGFGSPAITQLFGQGLGAPTLRISSDSAEVGRRRYLQLMLGNMLPQGLSLVASNFEAKIRFQSTILAPVKYLDWYISNDSTFVTLKGNIDTSNVLAELYVRAGLGTVEETTIDIVEFKLLDNLGNIVDYEFEKYPGTFKLLGICKDGGTRLINSSGKAGIQSIAPNPAGNSIDLEFSTSEIGFTEIAIYNILGEKVLTVFTEDISVTGKRYIKINSGEIGNGTYMVIFKSPTVVDTKQIMIVK